MLKEGQEIAYTEDIIDEVAREHGIPRAKVEYHMRFLVHWIKTLAKDPENLVIRIPHMGRMYANIGAIEKYLKPYDEGRYKLKSRQFISNYSRNKRRIEKFYEWYKDSTEYTRHKKRQKLFNNYFNKGKSLKELEQWQNKDL